MNYTELLIAREKELGRPVRVGLAGAGQMGSGLAAQIGKIPGMSLVACADIDMGRAENALKLAGIEHVKHNREASKSIESGQGGVVDNASALAELPIDIVFEATGVPWVGAEVAGSCCLMWVLVSFALLGGVRSCGQPEPAHTGNGHAIE